jgi:hypothetical protein
MNDYLTAAEAAALAGLTPGAIRAACADGRIVAEKRAGAWFIPRETFERWVNDAEAHRPGVKSKNHEENEK